MPSDGGISGNRSETSTAVRNGSPLRKEQSEDHDQSDDDKDGGEAGPGDKVDNVGKDEADNVVIELIKCPKL